MPPTKPDAETQLFVEQKINTERNVSDGKYAPILIQKIVFGVIIIGGTAAVSTLAYQLISLFTRHL